MRVPTAADALDVDRRFSRSAPEAQASGPDDPAPSIPPSRRSAARSLLALFLVVGLATAVVAGWQTKHAAARQSRQSFDQQASGIAATVTRTLQRDADLTT